MQSFFLRKEILNYKMVEPTTIVTILKSLWDLVKGTKNLKKPDDPTILHDSQIRRDFLNNNPNASIVYVNGDLHIGDSSQLTEENKEKIKKEFQSRKRKDKKPIDIVDNEFFNRIEKFKKDLPNSKIINPFIKYLDIDIKNILNLSIYAERLFDSGDSKEAQKVRDDIGLQYGKEGRKLCNLYLSGYIDGMTEYLISYYGEDLDSVKKEINDKIRKFVAESDYIFFIHSNSNKQEIEENIRECITNGEVYIAIHGAGSNIDKVREIIEELGEDIEKENYDINEENLKTLSLCPLLYIYLTKRKN